MAGSSGHIPRAGWRGCGVCRSHQGLGHAHDRILEGYLVNYKAQLLILEKMGIKAQTGEKTCPKSNRISSTTVSTPQVSRLPVQCFFHSVSPTWVAAHV